MRAQIRGLDMASKNTQDGISLIQTAEGGMQEIDNMVQRIRELAVQAANDTNDYLTADRKKLQDEVDQLTAGLDQMANQVEFNAKKLLNGNLTDAATVGSLLADLAVKMQNGLGIASVAGGSAVVDLAANTTGGTIGVAYQQAISSSISANSVTYTVGVTVNGTPTTQNMTAQASAGTLLGSIVQTSNVQSADAVSLYLGYIDEYIGQLQSAQKAGAPVDDLLAALAFNRQQAINIYSGLEKVSAMTFSYAATAKLKGNGLWFQTGANSAQGMTVGIGKITSDILGIGKGSGISTIKLDKANGIQVSAQIDIIDNALQYVTAQRAKLGAIQNRLEFTKSSLEVSSENLSASESRIRDTDMGKEMMKLTAANILQQAGISMLAQANQAPQSVLQLLR